MRISRIEEPFDRLAGIIITMEIRSFSGILRNIKQQFPLREFPMKINAALRPWKNLLVSA
jgi:hypothetical protein